MNYEPYIFTQVNFTTFQLYESEVFNTTLKPGLRHLDYAVAVDTLHTLTSAAISVIKTTNGECPPFCGRDHKLTGAQLQPYISEVGGLTN